MRETLQDLKTRRSCRKYKPEQIKEEELEANFGSRDVCTNRNGGMTNNSSNTYIKKE